MAGTYAPINQNYIVAQDSSTTFNKEVNLDLPTKAIQYQLKWETNVLGIFKFQATLFEDLWEDIPNCAIEVRTDGTSDGHKIVFIPDTYLLCRKIRLVWEPDIDGSIGSIDVAIRVSTT